MAGSTKQPAAAINENFYQAHKQVYGHAFRDQSCEIITLRVDRDRRGRHADAAEAREGWARIRPTPCSTQRRTVFDNGEALETPRYARDKLLADDTVARAGADRAAQFDHARAARLHRRPS